MGIERFKKNFGIKLRRSKNILKKCRDATQKFLKKKFEI
jgi:hypothetical protein